MSKRLEQKLGKLTLEKGVSVGQVSQVMGDFAQNVEILTVFTVLVLTTAITKQYSSVASLFRQIETHLSPHEIISDLKEELPEFLIAYTSLLRFRSFCKWGMFSSLVFAIWGIYLSYMDYLPIELGGPLTVLFVLLSFVFSTKLLRLRKALYGT